MTDPEIEPRVAARWLFVIAGVVVGLAVGVAVGFVLDDPADPTREETGTVGAVSENSICVDLSPTAPRDPEPFCAINQLNPAEPVPEIGDRFEGTLLTFAIEDDTGREVGSGEAWVEMHEEGQ